MDPYLYAERDDRYGVTVQLLLQEDSPCPRLDPQDPGELFLVVQQLAVLVHGGDGLDGGVLQRRGVLDVLVSSGQLVDSGSRGSVFGDLGTKTLETSKLQYFSN